MPFRFLARVVLLSLVLFVPASISAQLQQQPELHTASPDELAVVKVLLRQQDAWNRGDLDSFAKGYKDSPDIIFISREVSRGYTGMVEAYKRDYPNKAAMGTLTYSDLEAHVLDAKYAVVLGKYHLERDKKEGGNADGIFSLLFEKTAQGWKIILDHTS